VDADLYLWLATYRVNAGKGASLAACPSGEEQGKSRQTAQVELLVKISLESLRRGDVQADLSGWRV